MHIYNKLGITISIEVSKHKLRIAMSLYVYNKTYSMEIRSTFFLTSEGIQKESRCSFLLKKGFQKQLLRPGSDHSLTAVIGSHIKKNLFVLPALPV